MKIRWSRQLIVYIIPGIILVWALYLKFHQGPFYLRDIDPEYMYVISGLNCATFDFNKIGHVNHPGTPLQLLTGLFFRVIHLFAGQNDIITDVISNPEFYLSISSVMLTCITFFLILRLGMLVYRHTSSILGVLVLQASYFYSEVHFGILSRYTPDTLLADIIILFFILYIRYLYDQRLNVIRFSVLSGIVMGAGLVTKYNFIPLLFLPFILIPGWRNRAYYILSVIVSAFVFFLPVASKYRAFWQIVKEMSLHSGLYGSGERGIIDTSSFLGNIALVFKYNPSFAIITALGVLCILILIFRPEFREKNRKEFRFLSASFVTIVVGLAFTAKHFKGYYALPVLSLIPMIFYTIIRMVERTVHFRHNTLSFSILLSILLLLPFLSIVEDFFGINENLREKRTTETFIRGQISPEDYFVITPVWMPTPMPENAMVLGLSYLHHEKLFYLDYERIYPNRLTWEGSENPMKHMRMRVANLEEALLSGNGIYFYSKPGWNAPELFSYVELHAFDAGIRLRRDTVYSFDKIDEHIIRYRNIDGWRKTVDLICGFEKQNNGRLYSDDEQKALTGDYVIRKGISAHGYNSILLEKEMPASPCYHLQGIKAGDVVSSSVKSNISREDEIGNILIKCEYTDACGNPVVINSEPSPGRIHGDWYMSDLFAKIESQPADSSLHCYVEYNGDEAAHIDDFTLKAYSRNPQGSFEVTSDSEPHSHLQIDILPMMPVNLVHSAPDGFPIRIPAEGVFEP